MKTYFGDRTIDGIVTTVNGEELPDYSEIKCFTSAGFEWGFEGQSATQLAFALLYDHSGDTRLAKDLAQPFMKDVTANFGNEWELTTSDMDDVIVKLRARK